MPDPTPEFVSQVRVAYQPLQHLESGQVQGYEIFARIDRSDGKLATPSSIPHDWWQGGWDRVISEIVLEKLPNEIPLLWDAGLIKSGSWIALNLVDKQILDGPHPIIETILEAELTPIVEVNERVRVGDRMIRHRLQQLREMGARIALDDVGAGSLIPLLELPIDIVKIDRRFAPNTGSSRFGQVVLSALIDVCQKGDKVILIEGLESRQAIESARTSGCVYGQGYALGYPETLLSMLRGAGVKSDLAV